MGNNTLKVLKSLKFTNTSGENFSYDSATTAILGIVIEGATGKPYAGLAISVPTATIMQ